jgi:hypothetical protein
METTIGESNLDLKDMQRRLKRSWGCGYRTAHLADIAHFSGAACQIKGARPGHRQESVVSCAGASDSATRVPRDLVANQL